MCKRPLLFQNMYQPLNLLDAGMTVPKSDFRQNFEININVGLYYYHYQV